MSKTYKKPQQYKHVNNAICFTVYNLEGKSIPHKVKEEIEELITKAAVDNRLAVNVATT